MVDCKHSLGLHVDAVGPAMGTQSVQATHPPSPSPHFQTPINVGVFHVP